MFKAFWPSDFGSAEKRSLVHQRETECFPLRPNPPKYEPTATSLNPSPFTSPAIVIYLSKMFGNHLIRFASSCVTSRPMNVFTGDWDIGGPPRHRRKPFRTDVPRLCCCNRIWRADNEIVISIVIHINQDNSCPEFVCVIFTV